MIRWLGPYLPEDDVEEELKPIVELKAVNLIKNEVIQDDDTGEFHIKIVTVGYEIRYRREGSTDWVKLNAEAEHIDSRNVNT